MSSKLAALPAWLAVTAFFGIVGGYHLVPQLIYLYDLSRSNRVTPARSILKCTTRANIASLGTGAACMSMTANRVATIA
jgi:hypothetical protein